MWSRSSPAGDAARTIADRLPPLKILGRRRAASGTPTLVQARARLHAGTTIARARPRATCSGPATRTRSARCCTATSRPGCRRRCWRRRRASSATRCSRRPGTGACRCTSTRAWPAPRPRRSRLPETRPCNPAVLDAFAPAHQRGGGAAGLSRCCRATSPTSRRPRRDSAAIGRAMDEVRKLVPRVGAYVSESDYFEPHWQRGVLGRELRAAAGGQGPLRPGGPVLRAPRRRQRALERRRVHASGLSASAGIA